MLIVQANAFSQRLPKPEGARKNASLVTKAILEIIKSRYERMAGKAISVLRPLMFAKQTKMSPATERRDWNKSFDSKKRA